MNIRQIKCIRDYYYWAGIVTGLAIAGVYILLLNIVY